MPLSDEIVELLAGVLNCSTASATAAASAFRWRTLDRGEILVVQGDTCDRCWIVVDGGLAMQAFGLEGQQVQLASLGPGEIAGAFPTPCRQHVELCANARTRLLEAPAPSFARVAAGDPGIGLGLAVLLARQLERLIARTTQQFSLSAFARVYLELLDLADADGRIKPPPVLAALAIRVNTTRETASRAVAAAARRGLLARGEGELRITSRSRFETLVI